jgi:hypothetical protein
VLVQVANRLSQPGMMRLEHRPAGRRIPQAVQDRDALGRPQDHIKGGHGVAAMRAAKKLAARSTLDPKSSKESNAPGCVRSRHRFIRYASEYGPAL